MDAGRRIAEQRAYHVGADPRWRWHFILTARVRCGKLLCLAAQRHLRSAAFFGGGGRLRLGFPEVEPCSRASNAADDLQIMEGQLRVLLGIHRSHPSEHYPRLPLVHELYRL